MTYDHWKTTEPDPFDEPPQQWFDCDACDGAGEVPSGRMSHSVNSATIDPPWEIMETCGKCGGAGGWIDDVEPDAPAYSGG